MRLSTQGFTLIEWLIYFFLIMSVLTGMFHFVATVRHRLISTGRQSSSFSQLCAAQDALSRDLSMAPDQSEQWDKLGPESIAWRQGERLCCWEVESGTLVRREKQFDPAKKVWRSKRKSVVARGDIVLKVAPLYKKGCDQRLQDMELFLGSGEKISVRTTVMLRNGVLK